MVKSTEVEPQPQPDDQGEVAREISALEDVLFDDLDELAQSVPDPLAPIAEQIAHAKEASRVREVAEEISERHQNNQ